MTRRMTLMVLALLGLLVLVVTVSPPEQGGRKGAQTGTTPPASSQDLLSDPDAFDVQATLTTDGDAKPKTIEAELHDRVQILVNGSEPGSVELGELRIEELEEGVPARFELLAETPGTYPLVNLEDNRRIGTLEIR